MGFDPRDYDDARDNDRNGANGQRAARDRDDDARQLGRGPGDARESTNCKHGLDGRDDARSPNRDRQPRDRAVDPREPLTRTGNGWNAPRRSGRRCVSHARRSSGRRAAMPERAATYVDSDSAAISNGSVGPG
jgi:hypothetical protein